MTDVKLNGKSINNSKTKYAIVDTGTSLIAMAESDYLAFTSMIMKASSDFDCSEGFCFSVYHSCNRYWDNM